MKFINLIHTIAILAITASNMANAEQTEISTQITIYNLPSSPIVSSQTNNLTDDELLSCKAALSADQQKRNKLVNVDTFIPESLEYLNKLVKVTYDKMRNGVISHVTMKVALSLFNFNVDGFAAENIALYVSDGTQPFLPFKFANGVKITKVTPKGGTIIYRAEMPITKNHSYAVPLALAGKASATTTVCNDMKMVNDLLGRKIVIQYDYYDSNGVFFSSFTING